MTTNIKKTTAAANTSEESAAEPTAVVGPPLRPGQKPEKVTFAHTCAWPGRR
jgi:hypothetical protein